MFLFNSRFGVGSRSYQQSEVINPPADVADKNKQILDMIYSIDPVSGNPRGDLAIYLNENANPEVRAFVSSMMKEGVQDKGLSMPQSMLNTLKSTINDDDIAYFAPNDGEDANQYAERLNDFFDRVRKHNEDVKRFKEFQRKMNKKD